MNSINKKEIEKFSRIAEEWWNPDGKFKPLHMFNPIRIEHIRDVALDYFKIDKDKKLPFKDLKILDLTGAGDLFASGFLHGYINKFSIQESLQKGTNMSAKVIQQIGARI